MVRLGSYHSTKYVNDKKMGFIFGKWFIGKLEPDPKTNFGGSNTLALQLLTIKKFLSSILYLENSSFEMVIKYHESVNHSKGVYYYETILRKPNVLEPLKHQLQITDNICLLYCESGIDKKILDVRMPSFVSYMVNLVQVNQTPV